MTNLRKWIFTVYFKVIEKFLSFSGALGQIYQTSCPDWQSYRYRICLNCSRDFLFGKSSGLTSKLGSFILNLNQTTNIQTKNKLMSENKNSKTQGWTKEVQKFWLLRSKSGLWSESSRNLVENGRRWAKIVCHRRKWPLLIQKWLLFY